MSDFFILLECLADDSQWQQWEEEASKLEVTVDYYFSEFVLK
jgi:hypothetical protein